MTDSTQSAGSQDGTGSAGRGPAEPARHAHRGGRQPDVLQAWRALRRWRRARPFWAGVFLLAAGAELLLIPLPIHAMGLILHIGTGGVLGILIGAVLMVCALLIWISPAQRVFYSIVAVLLAIAALVASNLGGFLIGTLLGVLGGSLGFGWTPQQPGSQPARRWPRRKPAGPDDDAAPAGNAGLSMLPGGTDSTVIRASVLPLLLAAAAVLQITHAPAAAAQPAQHQSGCIIYIPVICPAPTPSPTTPAPGPTGSPGPIGSPSPGRTAGSPAPAAPPGTSPAVSPGGSPAASPSPSPRSGAAPAFAIATVPSSLTASSAVIRGFAYDGLATVPTAGGDVRMMQFSMSTITLSGMQLVAGSGAVLTTRAPAVTLSGNVTLYTTRLSGKLLGIPVTLTPGSPLSVILKAIAPLTKAIPVPMTDVAVSQPYTSAAGMSISGLHIS